MILERLLAHLATTPAASLGELARAVDASPEAVRSMLGTLQRRGLVHRRPAVPGCGSRCRQCDQGELEIYCRGPAPDTAGDGSHCANAVLKRNPSGD
jgi:hypothetical protein